MSEEMINKIEAYDLETAMKRLDEVAGKLSAESIGLSESLALYEEGVALIKHCNIELERVERRINILRTTDDGEVFEESFDTSNI